MLYLQIERERSKERLENKRRQDQLKKVFDEEKEEKKKKLSEVTENRTPNRNIRTGALEIKNVKKTG